MQIGDKVGGILLAIGAGFYGLNIVEAHQAQAVVGVSAAWALFFIILNAVYIYVFANSKLMWSAFGSFYLFLAELIYFFQILYYN